MNILILSGHGGTPYDPGAVGAGTQEAVLTRELARLIQTELQKIPGVRADLYDQRNDAYQVLKNGGALPLSGVQYVLEIHFNSAANDPRGDGRTTGTEVLVHPTERGTGVEEAICRRMAALGFRNRGVKRRSDLLVMNTVRRHGISHALVETCFVDDADDMKLYQTSKTRVAEAIAAGIAEGFGLHNYTESEVTDDMTIEEVRQMLQESFAGLYEQSNPTYTSIEQVPAYWRDEVQELVKLGAIRGDGTHEISIRRDALQAAVIAYRAATAIQK